MRILRGARSELANLSSLPPSFRYSAAPDVTESA